MTATTDTLADLDTAIRKFGAYNLHDKGAAEVMDVDAVCTRLRSAGIDETIKTLEALSALVDGAPLVHHLIMVFVEDDEWPELGDALAAAATTREQFVPWLAADGSPA